jgi:hypothetical protein
MYCKHFLSMLVFRDACERFHTTNGHRNGQEIREAPQEALQPEATMLSQPEATSPSQVWECAQAPSSCTLKWAINGIELMLTLRAADDQALFNRIGNVLPRIEEKMEAHRQQRQAERQAQVQQPGSGGNGNGHITNTGSSQPDDEDHWCHVHDTRLWMHTKNGQTWYSHRTENGTWCRGT